MNEAVHDPARLTSAEAEALEETLAAYALGALSEVEAGRVAHHLAICSTCRALASELAATVSLLPLVCDEVEPSPGLKGRVLAAVEAERGAPPGQAPADAAPPLRLVDRPLPAAERGMRADEGGAPTPMGPRPVPLGPAGQPTVPGAWAGPRPHRGTPWWWALPTAALLIVSLGLGAWNAQLQQDIRRQGERIAIYEGARQTTALAGTAEAPGARGVLVEPAAGGPPRLVLQDLPSLPADRAYQVWFIRGGQPVSAGVLPAGAGGVQRVELQGDPSGAQAVAVSEEPAGGSPNPTGRIVLSGNL